MLLAAGSAFAAAPVAEDATVWAVARYEVELGDGTSKFEIPIDLLAFASDTDGEQLDFTVTQPSPVGSVVHLGAGLALFESGVAELAAEPAGASFTYTVTDATGVAATATVMIVTLQNIISPVADAFDVAIDRPTTLPVLDNDQGADTILAFTQGTLDDTPEPRGVVELDGTGTALVFTPAADFASGETHDFTYTPAGPSGEGEPTQVTIIGVATAEPVLQVFQNWDDVLVPEGATVPFLEPVPTGEPDSLRFNLHNPTEEDIEVTNATTAVTGECFSVPVGDPVPSTVPPASTLGETDPIPGFRVRVQCPTSGVKTATVTLETSSASGTPYRSFTFTVRAEIIDGPTPLQVSQRWDELSVTEGALIQYPRDPLFYVKTSIGFDLYNPTTETLEITNAGNAVSGSAAYSITPGEPIPLSIGPGETAGFRLQLYWDAEETVTGTVTLKTQSATGVYEAFNFSVTATLGRPELDVFRGWPGADPAEIQSGGVIELPTLAHAGDPNHSVAFQISNEFGNGTLVIHNADSGMVSGDCFRIKTGGLPEEQVPVEGSTPFRVWWGHSCGAGTYSAVVRIETNSLYSFDPLDDGPNKEFTVVGRVAETPVLTCEPSDDRVVAGDPATFTVCTSETNGTLTYAWFKDGQAVAGSGPSLSIAAVAEADEGLYHVEVSNEVGTTVSRSASLTVVQEPVVSKPLDQTVNSGETATFSVTVSSPPEDGPFTYVWQELPPGAATFQTITGESTDTLTLSGVTTAMDGSFYRCLVSNDAGQSNPGRGKLTVVAAPVITQQPQSQRVVTGSNVNFSVTATGSPEPTYMWRKDGSTIGVTTPTLPLSEVTDSDEGLYKVRVSNSEGWVDSQGATLTVVEKPVVSRPTNQSAAVGGSATFSVTVSSPAEDGPFSYKWQQRPPGASTFQTVSGATNASLTVSNITLAMDGTKYRCLVSNDAGQTNSLSGTLSVLTGDVKVTRNWDGMAVGEGTTFDYGTVERSVSASRLFRITNVGDATLTLSNPTSFVSGTCWSQIENAASSVAPGGYTTFRVRILCSSTGTKTGTVTIQSSDPSSPYVFNVRATVVASNVKVYQDWSGLAQSEGSTYTYPDTLTGTAVSRRFRITNNGQATLTISNPTSLVSGTCWSQIENAASSVAPGASTYFRVRLLCSSAGTKNGTITIYSNDPSSPYRFYVQGTVTEPEPGNVTVYRAWNGVVQGEGTTFPFPDTTTGSAVSRRFRITNTGSGTLTISNPTSFVSGTCWSQIENASSSVAPGASTYFRVRLLCSTTGTKNGTITIYSNDTSSPYRFYVQGTVN